MPAQLERTRRFFYTEAMEKFQDILSEYMEQLDCTGRALADEADVSPVLLSRYKNGTRVPAEATAQVMRIAQAIERLAAEQGIPLSHPDVNGRFQSVFADPAAPDDSLMRNFNTLVHLLDLKMGPLAKELNFDVSYLFRIRSGERRPGDPKAFAEGVAEYVVRVTENKPDRSVLCELCSLPADTSDALITAALERWLSGTEKSPDLISGFLNKLDDFDLNEYIESIHFNEIRVPTVPFKLPRSHTYHGLSEMKKGELDFFKSTVLSRSDQDVCMCSDMPMEDMAEDVAFGKKWMMGLALILRKGLKIRIVHNLDRPFRELMLGLESWIPLYMTGQVSPYYLKNSSDSYYRHLLYVSGAAALSGECIAGKHEAGKYYLTNGKEEMAYYSRRSRDLFALAQPLMEIYRTEEENVVNAFLMSELKKGPVIRLSRDGFKNISMQERSGEWIMITKTNAPKMWFLIRHPKLIRAIESFVPPVSEE